MGTRAARVFLYLGLGAALVLAAGCASGPKRLEMVPDMARVWPVPPDPPRIAYLHQIRTPADAGVRRGMGARIAAFFTGTRRPPRIEQPIGLYADTDGWLLVADAGLQVVHIFNLKQGTYAQAFELPDGRLASPVGVALDPERGWVFVADSIHNQIFVYDTKGDYVGRFGEGLTRVSGLAWDRKHKRLLATDTANHRVVVYDADGRQTGTFGERGDEAGQFNFPTGIALAPDGTIYVSDSLNFRVQAFDPDFKSLRQVGHLGATLGSFSKPKGVAVDSGGRLYVVDGLYDVVQLFDDEGRLLMFFGGSGSQPGHLWLPAGIAVAGNDIFVADTRNRRVQVFRLLSTATTPEPAPGTTPVATPGGPAEGTATEPAAAPGAGLPGA
jgi:DNA-binding beta-propeller fold protein YncE